MARKPAHLTPAGAPTLRDRVWTVLRARREGWSTLSEIMLALGERAHRRSVGDILRGLARAGYLEAVQGGRFEPARYRLVRDVGVDAPRVRTDGTEVPTPGRTKMWRVMPILKRFTLVELVAHADASIAEGEALYYCKMLARAGYLQKPGEDGRYTVIPSRLTGPRAPITQRAHVVYDPNTGKVVWPTHLESD